MLGNSLFGADEVFGNSGHSGSGGSGGFGHAGGGKGFGGKGFGGKGAGGKGSGGKDNHAGHGGNGGKGDAHHGDHHHDQYHHHHGGHNPPCFVAGTLIATPNGERAVETLGVGDLVRTADGRDVAVRFIGQRTVSKTFTSAEAFAPVRVRAGVLGNGAPHADLTLTADHALILDGFAINAGALVNGTTITREPLDALPEQLTYYQVETEAHETILAMGAAVETLVDYGSRRVFDNYADYVALYPDEPVIAEMAAPRITARHQVPAALRKRLDRAVAA